MTVKGSSKTMLSMGPWFVMGALSAGMMLRGTVAPRATAAVVAAPPAAPAQPPAMAELAKLRYQIATQGYGFAMAGHQPTDAPGPDAIEWMRRRVRARLELVEPKGDRVAFLNEYVGMLRSQEAFEERMVKSRLSSVQSLLRAQYDRIEGEMLLQQAEAK